MHAVARQTVYRWLALQWGHVFVDVEMTLSWIFLGEDASLQWGHVFVDVEIASSVTI